MSIPERFWDRVILGEENQKMLLESFLNIYNWDFERAAQHINGVSGKAITARTLRAYFDFQNKSLAKFAFEAMIGELMTEVKFEEKALREIRGESLSNEWIKNREKMSEIVRKASKNGVRALEIKYGKDWPRNVMEGLREKMKIKYGENWPKLIGAKGSVVARKKYGDKLSEILSKTTSRGLRKKYGENWRKLIGDKMISNIEIKYGKDWPQKIGRRGWEKLVELYGKESTLSILERARNVTKEKYPGKKLWHFSVEAKRPVARCRKLGLNYLIVRDIAQTLLYKGSVSDTLLSMSQEEALKYLQFIQKYFKKIYEAMGLELTNKKLLLEYDERKNVYTLRTKLRRKYVHHKNI